MEQTGIGQIPEEGCSKVKCPLIWISTVTTLWVEFLIRGTHLASTICEARRIRFCWLLNLTVDRVFQGSGAHWVPNQPVVHRKCIWDSGVKVYIFLWSDDLKTWSISYNNVLLYSEPIVTDDMSLFSKSMSWSCWLMLPLMSNLSPKALFFNFLSRIYRVMSTY